MKTSQKDSSTQTRLNYRVSAVIKRRAEAAAEVLGQSITAFTETALAEKAEAVFSQFSAIRLSERDFQRFVKAINHAPDPTVKLRRATAAYRKLRAREPQSNW